MRSYALNLGMRGLLLVALPWASGCAADAPPAEGETPAVAQSALGECVEEASEPNDARTSAAPHTFGTAQQGAICSPNRYDFYSFQGPAAGQAFAVRLEFLAKTAEMDVYLTDAAGNFVTSSFGAGDNRVISAVSNGGRYYLQVYGQRSVPYRLVSALGNLPRCAEPDLDEPNDFFGEFKTLPFGATYSAFSCAGENDYYQFQGPPAGQEFTVNLVFDHEVGDLDFNLQSTTSAYRASSRNDNETVSVVSNGGIYSLQVAGPNFNNTYGSGSNSYEIRTELGYKPVSSCASDDAFEPNDRPSLAASVTGTGDVAAYLCGALPDYYTFAGPPAGTPFFVNVQFAGPVDATVDLINQAGVTVATGRTLVDAPDGAPAAELVGSESDGGTYQLVVRSSNDAIAQAYGIHFSSPELPPLCVGVEDSYEPNDSSFRATAVPYPGRIEASSCQGNVDQFRFQGPPSRVHFEVEVAFDELAGPVQVRLLSDAGVVQEKLVTKPGLALFEQSSNGGRYRVLLDPRTAQSNRYSVTLRDAPRLCSVSAEIGSLGLACGTANGGPFANVQASLSDVSAPALSEGVSYNVTLAESAVGNRGSLSFTPTETGAYTLFTGTPGVRTEVRSLAGVVEPECVTALDAHECNKLKRVYRHDLVAGVRYVIDLGPSFPQKFVRLGLQRTTVSALECTNQQLPDRAAACVRDLVDAAVQAGPLETAGPSIIENALTLVQLSGASGEKAGSVSFTPPLSGAYELFLSSAVPVVINDETSEAPLTCQRNLPAADCAAFRRALTVQLDSRRTYRLDLGPTTASGPRLLLKRVQPPTPAVCGPTELPDLAKACTLPASAPLPDIDATPLGDEGLAVSLPSGVASNVHLVQGAEGNAGALSFQPAASGSYQLFLGAPHIPFRIYDGLFQLPATCTEQLTATECLAFRRGTRFELQADRVYRVELGPITPSNRVRVLLDSSND
ncbi:MAG: hypothetical protein EOO73_14250 [Myxococcales bacterium]|nr:MAG: hypothetical protein EOO73_14250 [Myxococcales bacterium]